MNSRRAERSNSVTPDHRILGEAVEHWSIRREVMRSFAGKDICVRRKGYSYIDALAHHQVTL
eukprot:3126114-Prymnesium_polylepis.3